ncbi:hypothetical protein L1987_78580 [Smallanthus sonchifolius]|uniref:Uncharacterized protein n=1 Tax=Smallanthus sonchifolius TaxID=185202 RepID=A0ACB8ZCR6_9ASTR|nr:hypothetical protein L1987_78580 [Smallanthus sonchifolius]
MNLNQGASSNSTSMNEADDWNGHNNFPSFRSWEALELVYQVSDDDGMGRSSECGSGSSFGNWGLSFKRRMGVPESSIQSLEEAVHHLVLEMALVVQAVFVVLMVYGHLNIITTQRQVSKDCPSFHLGLYPSAEVEHGRHRGDDWRALAADIEGRQRLVSEIRHVLKAMRRGENLRAEDHMLFDPFINGIAELHDRHRDLRLDVDNMYNSYYRKLEERIGDVNTGLSEEVILCCFCWLTIYKSVS